jgi:hypothetical protein
MHLMHEAWDGDGTERSRERESAAMSATMPPSASYRRSSR